MNHTYNIKLIGKNHLDTLAELIQIRALIPDPHSPTISGCAGASVYQLADPTDLQMVDDFGISIGGRLLQANLFRLPSWAMRAAFEGQPMPDFEGTHDLIRGLSRPLSQAEKLEWIDTLKTTVKQGRMADIRHHSAYSQDHGTTKWMRGSTRFCHQPGADHTGSWTLSLSFERIEEIIEMGVRKGAMGVDVGSNPLVVIASGDDLWQVGGINPIALTEEDLRRTMSNKRQAHLAKRLHHLAHSVAAKIKYERALEQLKCASSVSAEDITLTGMHPRFQQLAGDLGLQDFLLAWLPQMCHQHFISLVRVDPFRSSQTCHICHQQGSRSKDGKSFHCTRHGTMDAHENAAKVIQLLGMGATLSKVKQRSMMAGQFRNGSMKA